MTLYLVNPGKRKKKKRKPTAVKRRAKRTRARAKQRSASPTRQVMAKTKRKSTRKRRATPKRRSTSRRRRVAVYAGPRRKRRRSYRRNPPVGVRSITKQLTGAVQDAAVGAAAQLGTAALARQLPNFIDPPAKGGKGVWGPRVNQFLAGAAVGIVARMILGADMGRAALQGALTQPIVETVEPYLQGTAKLSAYPMIGAYPRAQLGAYARGPRLLAGDPSQGRGTFY